MLFNEHWFDQKGQLIGVGAYRLEKFEAGRRISFVRNPDYWGKGTHYQREIWDGRVKDPTAKLVAFKNGEFDFGGLTPQQFKSDVIDHNEKRFAAYDPDDAKAGRAGELGWEKVVRKVCYYIGWNMRGPLFGDQRVRHAMSHAFPRERILREVYFNLGRPLTSVVHPDQPEYNDDLQPWPFDLSRAEQLLTEAGWSDSDGDGVIDRQIDDEQIDFRFEMLAYADSPENSRMLAIFTQQLQQLGIAMSVKELQWPDLVERMQNLDFAAYTGGWRMGGELDFYQLWHSSHANDQGTSNMPGVQSADADELIMAMRASFDTEERADIARKFQRLIYNMQPYTFIRSGESVSTWHNVAAEGQLSHGVEIALDTFHPFVGLGDKTPLWFSQETMTK